MQRLSAQSGDWVTVTGRETLKCLSTSGCRRDTGQYYGEVNDTRLIGEQLRITRPEAFIAAIEAVGGRCERDDELIKRAYGG